MKAIRKEVLFALAALSFLPFQAAANDGEILTGLMRMAGPAGETLPAAPAVQGAPVAAIAHYAGEIEINGAARRACFTMSTEVINPYEGDPDVRGNYSYQEIPVMRQDGAAACSTRLEHNGRYILSCSGHYLILDSSGHIGGSVFTTLKRFNPDTGALAVEPVGRFKFEKASACKRSR